MKRFSLFFLPLAAVFGFSGCPADLEMAPAFVLVENLVFDAGNTAGGSTAAITEVWAFSGTEFIGAFPLPARIPVLKAGPTNIRLEAGVRQNGISSTPEFYEFYQPVDRTLDLVPGEAIDLGVQTVTYRPEVKFGFIEDFEANTERVFTEIARGVTGLELQTEVVRTGSSSGVIRLDTANSEVLLSSGQLFTDLLDERPYVWLEMDFRAEAPTRFGVSGSVGFELLRSFDPGFFPRAEWTKIYFNMSETIFRSEIEEYRIDLNSVLPTDMLEADVYLDNVKLLYF